MSNLAAELSGIISNVLRQYRSNLSEVIVTLDPNGTLDFTYDAYPERYGDQSDILDDLKERLMAGAYQGVNGVYRFTSVNLITQTQKRFGRKNWYIITVRLMYNLT